MGTRLRAPALALVLQTLLQGSSQSMKSSGKLTAAFRMVEAFPLGKLLPTSVPNLKIETLGVAVVAVDLLQVGQIADYTDGIVDTNELSSPGISGDVKGEGPRDDGGVDGKVV